MSDSHDAWYRIGYALEAVTQRLPAIRDGAQAARAENPPTPVRPESTRPGDDWLDQILAVGTGAIASRFLGVLPGRGSPGKLRVARAALAGAGAAVILSLLRRRATDGTAATIETDPLGEILAGAGRGIVYGVVLEPHLIGPGLVRGTLSAALEYTAAPWGGIDGVLGAASPRRTLPILGALLNTDSLVLESLTEQLIFGSTLGILYGVAKDNSGSVEDE